MQHSSSDSPSADRTLRALLRAEGALPFDRTARLLAELAEGVAGLHAAGRAHGAISPQSVHLDSAGVARLGPPAVDPGAAAGLLPPAYLAPERIDGAPADARSDVYALGLLGWEMLSGETPYAGASLREVVEHQRDRDLPRLTTLRPGVPRPLLFAIEGALHKSPADRWANAGEMLAQLRQGIPEDRIVPLPPPVARPLARPIATTAGEHTPGMRWGRRLGALALLLVVAVAGLGALVALQGRSDATPAAPWIDSLTTSSSGGVVITSDTSGDTAARLRGNRPRVDDVARARQAQAAADSARVDQAMAADTADAAGTTSIEDSIRWVPRRPHPVPVPMPRADSMRRDSTRARPDSAAPGDTLTRRPTVPDSVGR